MSQIQQLNINLEGIGGVLKSRRFKVPAYQRSFAWEIDHVDALLDDIREAIINKEREYFLGSIVVTSGNGGRYEVVDGQQRLTTISLIIAAIKEIFQRDKDHDVVVSVKSDFLASTDRRTREREPKLMLNEIDNEIYQDLIEGFDTVDSKRTRRQSHKRLVDAAKHCFNYLTDICTKSKDSEEELHAWLDYIESSLKVIVVTAPDDSNAFVIFETLNDRGLELAISDLVKNYLFHKSGEKLEETKNRWLSMVSILESASDDPLIVTYIRHFSMAKYGLIREKELFSLLKTKITSKKNTLKFSTELADTVRIYSALINTDHEYWSEFSNDVKYSVATLNLLGMTQIRPLLLAVLSKFEPKKVSKTFKNLVSAAVRYQMVGGIGGGTLERVYSETAKAISEEKIKDPTEVIKAFTNIPSDTAFRSAFSIASVSKQKIARFYLRELEIAISEHNSETIPNYDTDHVNLEHILPSTPDADWRKYFNDEEIHTYHNRLGNLAIMASKINSTIGNDSFEDKAQAYKDSKFHFTKAISNSTKWTKAEIEHRQAKMADVAIKHWAI
ncbi:uncharacterized protein DUF1524 [Nitrosomonas ureae]|uniref:DUF262 domain-containing protein n=1 Tax=Nitrosomonas ureae TaxID=44577 RepID=A0A286ABF8_9PROT|nr:DUF262 domain-containing protein [Nitrosomonas ureae]PXX15997.1 uncharacterized protein DUF1524 [Nitrosomonas ureae]SOD19243.1 Protein of unknown function [Nitrosomonas ureae]